MNALQDFCKAPADFVGSGPEACEAAGQGAGRGACGAVAWLGCPCAPEVVLAALGLEERNRLFA